MTTDLHGPLAAYAARLHATIGDRHHVAAPLGAWLLLALAAVAEPDQADRPLAEALTDALGTDLASAAAIARALLDAPHPLVASATALWHRPGQGDGGPTDWRPALPATTEVGALPDQAGLDAWAREHTLGLIERFPLRVGPDVVLALASALATRISWAEPFDVAEARALGADSVWARRLRRRAAQPGAGAPVRHRHDPGGRRRDRARRVGPGGRRRRPGRPLGGRRAAGAAGRCARRRVPDQHRRGRRRATGRSPLTVRPAAR
ncbi:hypothetical protein [Micromonospora parastrephiae]|uniref:hypothetical protein n=1 Tax=Micromonospora parastrephiae TaxID=2806101 RepID=UPI001EE4C685|nr:hypothetical protein [Micromonospora parastrephiae]